jgi:aryl-alcohol dehydrogenase-like predicted oxidoreductase
MEREINGTGIRVRAIGLGAMPLSIARRPDEAQALEVIDAFIGAGGNFIDTANVYCLDDADIGHNERLIRKALSRHKDPERIIIATKGGLRRPRGEWTVDGHPEWLRKSCEQSLNALGTTTITLYQLHAVDPAVDLLDSLGALVRLKEEGKILHIGLSNVSPAEIERALRFTPIASVQNRCNPFDQRDFHNGLIETCSARGLTYIPYSPVGGHHGHVRLPRDPVLRGLAEKHGVSAYRIALAWFLHKGEHILPIPAASKPSSILDSLESTELRLDAADIAAIDELGGR